MTTDYRTISESDLKVMTKTGESWDRLPASTELMARTGFYERPCMCGFQPSPFFVGHTQSCADNKRREVVA